MKVWSTLRPRITAASYRIHSALQLAQTTPNAMAPINTIGVSTVIKGMSAKRTKTPKMKMTPTAATVAACHGQ